MTETVSTARMRLIDRDRRIIHDVFRREGHLQ